MLTSDEIIKIIKEVETCLAFDNVEVTCFDIEDGELYSEFQYQIDDRLNRSEEEVIKLFKEKLGTDYGVDLDCWDTFPNGYSAHKLTIDRC